MENTINVGIYLAYILVGIAAVTAVVFPIIQMVGNFAKAKGALIGIAVLAIVFVIGYSMATNEVYDGAGALTSRLIGAGIYSTFILVGLGTLSAIFTEVSKLFK